MSDEQFEQFLKRETAAYNTPPATPRDEMWQVIAKARAGRATAGGTGLRSLTTSRKPWMRYAPWIGMAATLLVGVGIGRYAMNDGATSTLPAVTLASDTPASTPGIDAATPAVEVPGATSPAPVATPERRAPRSRETAVRMASAPNGFTSSNGTADPAAPMQVASREHLVRAEALISVIAATPADAVMDSLTGRWARDMLTNTRLLLDSPAGDDPARRQLLEDLETVLVQLVQRSGSAREERALIDRSLQRTQLLTRLRTSATGI